MKSSCGESRQSMSERVVKRALGAVFTVGLLMAAQGADAAGRVFYDDFESGTTSKWTCLPSAVVVNSPRDGGPGPHGGSKMLKCIRTVPSPSMTRSYTQAPTSNHGRISQEILLRAWVRYDADVDNVFGNKILRLGKYPQQSFYLQGTTNGEMLAYFEQIEGVNGPSKYFPGAILNRQWHKFRCTSNTIRPDKPTAFSVHGGTGQNDRCCQSENGRSRRQLDTTKCSPIGANGWPARY